MRIQHSKRALWLLPFVLFATSLLFAKTRDQSKPPKEAEDDHQPTQITNIIYRIIANEWQIRTKLEEYSPRIETYVQYYKPEVDVGEAATNDDYFLGRLKFESGKLKIASEPVESSFIPDTSIDHRFHLDSVMGKVEKVEKVKPVGAVAKKEAHLQINQFAIEPLVVDENNFDRKHYIFEPVRWEYLGDVRCLAMDVHPRNNRYYGAFVGRIWVDDQNYAIVRLNGTRINPPHHELYVHFDSWRENLQPGMWLPVYIYSQESDRGKRLRYRSETRLWGYDLNTHRQQQEWTNIAVESPAPVRDNSEVTSDLTPVESWRQLTMDAERNVLDRLEKARLIAPPGPVDKVLETVVNNLRVTNHLDNMPPVHCRVMLTSTLESFSLAYTIVLSRGLIDVLPDEASLASVIAHELAHIALGHKLDTKYAFNDRMQVTDEQVLASLDVVRPKADEAAADAKAMEFLKNSPYADKLGQAGLFLRAAAEAAPHVPHLFGPHLGNGLTEGNDKTFRMSGLMGSAPALTPKNVTQIAALPLGSRVQVNALDGSVAFTTRKTVALVDASEKLPFRITPVVPYLRFCPPATKSLEAEKKPDTPAEPAAVPDAPSVPASKN